MTCGGRAGRDPAVSWVLVGERFVREVAGVAGRVTCHRLTSARETRRSKVAEWSRAAVPSVRPSGFLVPFPPWEQEQDPLITQDREY